MFLLREIIEADELLKELSPSSKGINLVSVLLPLFCFKVSFKSSVPNLLLDAILLGIKYSYLSI